MKKLAILALAGVLVFGLMPGAATAGKKGKKGKQQKVEGSVAGAVRHPDGCYSGVHRRAQAVAGENAQGVVGYDFDVDKATWNKPFVLELVSGQGRVDLDITYYLGERTTVNDFVEQQGDPAVPPTVGYETREVGGEADIVPEAAVWAIVCIYENENGDIGALADFSYVAGAGVKLPK